MISNKLLIASFFCSVVVLKAEDAKQPDLTNVIIESTNDEQQKIKEEIIKQDRVEKKKEEKTLPAKPAFDVNIAYNAMKEDNYEEMLKITACQQQMKLLRDEAIKRADPKVAQKILYLIDQNKQTEKNFKTKHESTYARAKNMERLASAAFAAVGSLISIAGTLGLLSFLKIIHIGRFPTT